MCLQRCLAVPKTHGLKSSEGRCIMAPFFSFFSTRNPSQINFSLLMACCMFLHIYFQVSLIFPGMCFLYVYISSCQVPLPPAARRPMASESYSYTPQEEVDAPAPGTLIATAPAAPKAPSPSRTPHGERRRKSRSKRKDARSSSHVGRGRSPERPARRGKSRSKGNPRERGRARGRKRSPSRAAHPPAADRRKRPRCDPDRSPAPAPGGGGRADQGKTVDLTLRPNEPAEPPKKKPEREESSESTITRAAKATQRQPGASDNVKCEYCWQYHPQDALKNHQRTSKFCLGWQIYQKQPEGAKCIKQAKWAAHDVWANRQQHWHTEPPKGEGPEEKPDKDAGTGNPTGGTQEKAKKRRRRRRHAEEDGKKEKSPRRREKRRDGKDTGKMAKHSAIFSPEAQRREKKQR